jgi:hypothetical protein
MTPVGLARANQLANRDPVSLDTVQRMVSYFARHEVDKQGATWDEQGKGWQAWHGWGGDEGRTWANQIMKENTMETKASRRHSEADMKRIRAARRMAENIKSYMVELGDDMEDDDETKAVKVLTPDGLSPRQESVVLALTDIVVAQGKFSKGISESGAQYVEESLYKHSGIMCMNCVFYQDGMCAAVEGVVNHMGMCKYWVIPEKTLVLAALEPMPHHDDMVEYVDDVAVMMGHEEDAMQGYEMKAESDIVALDTPLTIEVGDEVKALARRLLGVVQ